MNKWIVKIIGMLLALGINFEGNMKAETEFLDFNGDGAADLLIVDAANNYWIAGYPDLFHVHTQINGDLSTGAPNVFFGDFDGDGKTDTLNWRQSVTTSSFTVTTAVGTSFSASLEGSYDTSIGDFDGDGRSDVLAIRKSTNEYYVVSSKTTPLDSIYLLTKPGGNFDAFERKLGDFNGDGKTDVALRVKPRNDAAAGDFYVFLGHDANEASSVYGGNYGGLAKFTKENAHLHTISWKVGDFDGDGTDDLIALDPSSTFWVASLKNGQWYRYADNSSTGWRQKEFLSTLRVGGILLGTPIIIDLTYLIDQLPYITDWKVGDFNNDQKEDLMIAGINTTTNQNIFWRVTGPGAVEQFQVHPGGPHEWRIGDVDGNGIADLVYADQNNDFYVTTSPGSPAVLWANYEGGLNEKRWEVKDYTGDGKDEILFWGLYDGAFNKSRAFYLTSGPGQSELYLSQYLDTANNLYRFLPYRWYADSKVNEAPFGNASSAYNEVVANMQAVPDFYTPLYEQPLQSLEEE